uniref:Uncharacterized protein n=1 Tax=Anguilla anguilla TaxID=7936 RepID=A0A0E9RR40_ANGAN
MQDVIHSYSDLACHFLYPIIK